MVTLKWQRLIGQDRIKEVFSSAFSHGTLGHAYLLCGDSGVGTFAAALDLSMALLCSHGEVRPCSTCESCRKVLGYSHPDFHVVMPLSLQKEHKGSDGKITDEGWEEFGARVKERTADPYSMPEYTALPAIPVEWVREITHAIRRGATEKGKNIVILDGIDVMQQESANAMLKTLEEPPDDTLLLLCTDRPHAVLPTIVSRCQILRFTALAPDTIRSELVSRLSIKPDDPRLDEVVHCGSLGRALSLFGQADGSDTRDALEFWHLIITGDWIALFEKIDTISELGDYGRYKNLFVQLLYNIRNAFFANIGGTENYIMGGSSLQGTRATITTPHAAEVLAQYCETAIGQIRARANIALVLTNFALSVMEFQHGKKQ